jgi:hypothetical protein
LGTNSDWLTFIVAGDKSPVQQLRDYHDYTNGETTVPSGQSASRVFNLTPYFDLHQPGRYTVKATLKIPQWQTEITVPPVAFTIVNGIRLANVPDLPPVGVPLLTNQELRRYFLERSDVKGNSTLYVRLTDATGSHTHRLVPIGPYFSFTRPDVMLDRFNDLHVLHQTGAQTFTYCVVDTLGQILQRQTYQYTDQRPALRADNQGEVLVTGGARVVTAGDLPPPQPAAPMPPANTNLPGGRR